MKKNVLKLVGKKVDGKMIMAKSKVETVGAELLEHISAKKEGANTWTDILIASLVGLVIGALVKDGFSTAVTTIINKITTNVGTW